MSDETPSEQEDRIHEMKQAEAANDAVFGCSWFMGFLRTLVNSGYSSLPGVDRHVAVDQETFNEMPQWARLTRATTASSTSLVDPVQLREWLGRHQQEVFGQDGVDVDALVEAAKINFGSADH